MRVVVFLAFVALAWAQVEHQFDAYRPGYNKGINTALKVLPPMDIEAELARVEHDEEQLKIWEFAKINNVSAHFFKDAARTETETGTVFSLTYRMENALSMAFFFSEFDLPVGGAMFLTSQHETAGPWTHENKWDTGAFQTRHVAGNQVPVEYFETRGTKGLPKIALEVVTTAFRQRGHNFHNERLERDSNGRNLLQNAGTCNINSICNAPTNTCNQGCAPTTRTCSVQCSFFNQRVADGQWCGLDWDGEIRATVAVGRNMNSRYCSGAFINNANRRQYVLTAAHCGPGANDIIMVGFANPQCNSPSNSAGDTTRVAGNLRRLARNVRVDNELVEVGEVIPRAWGVYLAGWEAGDEGNGATGVVGIHHPSGSNKKISNSDVRVTAAAWSGTAPPLDHWRVATWSEATTEPGSSGSPLFNRQKRIIGQLHGGSAACPARNGFDSYGAVWAGYAQGGMGPFLGPTRNMDGRELYDADI